MLLTLVLVVAVAGQELLQVDGAAALVGLSAGALVTILAARAGVKRPLLAILVVVMALNVANYSVLTFSASGDRLSGSGGSVLAALRAPLLVGIILLLLRRSRSAFWSMLRREWDVLAFACSAFLGAVYAPRPIQAIAYAIWLALALAVILGVVVGQDRDTSERWLRSIAYSISLAYLPLVFLGARGLGTATDQGAVYAAFVGSNIYAVAAMLVLANTSILLTNRTRAHGAVVAAGLALVGLVSLALIIFSAKRSTIVGAALIVVVATLREFTRGRWRPRRALAFLLLLVVSIAGSSRLIRTADRTIFRVTRLAEGVQDASVGARVELLDAGWRVFREFPIAGVGLTGFGDAVASAVPGTPYAGYGLHNTYAAILVEMGLIGSFLFGIVVLRSIGRGLRSGFFREHMTAYLLLAGPPVLYGLTEYNLTPGQIAFWPLWIGLLIPRIAAAPPPASPTQHGRLEPEHIAPAHPAARAADG